jgi:hypothetical protein
MPGMREATVADDVRMIQVNVAQVSFSDIMGFVVLLKGVADHRTLPILIGAPEAQAIAMILEKVQAPRPLTHDLFKTVLDELGCRLKRIEVVDLRDNTFFARLILESGGVELAVDARPSDAVALSLRCGSPVYVAASVMDSAGVVFPDEKAKDAAGETGDPKAARLESLRKQIEKAVEDERYEDAAKLRDEIQKLTKTN